MCRVNFTPNGQAKIEINGYRSSSELEVSSHNNSHTAKITIILGAVRKPWF